MRIVFLPVVLAASVLAQHHGAVSGGSVSAPAIAPAPVHAVAPARIAAPPPTISHSVAPPARYPMPVAPRPVVPRLAPPSQPRSYTPRTVVVPYPVFIGGGYSSDYAAVPDAAPLAVVNQDYRPDAVNPVIMDYSNAALPDAPLADDIDTTELRDDQPTVFLIALKDHTVVAAIAYWVQDDGLNWISRDAKTNMMSLSLVDRTFSKQLNDERKVQFRLPPEK